LRLDASSLAPILVIGLTSAGLYLTRTRGYGLSVADLPKAIGDVLEALGLAIVFLLGNVAMGTIAILGLRALTGYFVSIYVVSDVTLPILSLIQALIYQRWRGRSR
jgi:hypothetical protein